MCCVSYSDPSPLLPSEKSKEEEQRCSAAMEADAEASYSYGFHPPGRHQPYAPPPPPPPEDGELWEYFPCPFCYIEVEMPFICSHLQEEHCFDTRNAVCPICAENLGKDMSAHFRFQHCHLLKRRKPSRPSSSPWPAATPPLPAYEVNTYMMSSRPCQDPEPDPLLSQFICGSSADQTEPGSRDGSSQRRHRPGSAHPADAQRPVSQLELEERLQRIEFLREIITSTIL